MRPIALSLLLALTCARVFGEAIPRIDTSALDGTPVHLPRAADRRPTVLILGFSKKSSEQAVVWGKRLWDAPWNDRQADSYELAMLGEVPGFLRGVVLRSLRRSTPLAAQSRLVPLYVDEQRWRDAAQVSSTDQVYLLLVDGAGAVRWRGKGGYSDQMFQQVSHEIEELQK